MVLDWGGLGINRVRDLNTTSGKMIMAFSDGEDELWKRVIFYIYEKYLGGWSTKRCFKTHGCGS